MEKIQSIYIFILKYTYKITGKIDQRIRNIVIWFASFALIWLCIYNYAVWSRGADTTQFERDIIGCVLLAIIALFSVDRPLEKILWNRQIVFIWYVFALLLFISGCLHSVENSYWLWSISMLIGFPGFYLIWQNRKDYETLFTIIASAMLVAIVIYFVICLGTISNEVNLYGRYWAFMRNPNHLGKVAVSGMAAILYLFFKSRYGWLLGIPSGICICLAVLSGSRAAMIIIVAQVVAFIIFNLKTYLRTKQFRETILTVIFFVVISCAAYSMAERGLEYCQIHNSETVSENVDNTVEQSVAGASIEENNKVLADRFHVEGKTPNQISSGRLDIWKYFLKKINLLGNDWEKYKAGTPEYAHQWAHNDVIEISYRSGVFAGIFDVLFLMYLGIYILKTLFSKNIAENSLYFVIFSILAYGGYAMLDVISFPFSMQYTFMFFVSLMPVFERRNELCLRCKSQ